MVYILFPETSGINLSERGRSEGLSLRWTRNAGLCCFGGGGGAKRDLSRAGVMTYSFIFAQAASQKRCLSVS